MFFKLAVLLFVSANFLFVDARVDIDIKEARVFNNNRPGVSVRTRLGTVVGIVEATRNIGKVINVFFGIPYAIPPVGKLRFQRTKLLEKLPHNPYHATRFRPHCAQQSSLIGIRYNPNDTFSEDCLNLNLFTPDLRKVKINGKCHRKFKVVVLIPGHLGSNSQQLPWVDEFGRANLALSGNVFSALHDIILVSLNYRAGLFATLVLGNKLNGNLGLFDQNLAIQWVRKNIGDYCGDAYDITLAGGKDVGLHVISPKSKKLIKNAILESNSPLFVNDEPATRNEIVLSSFLAINDLYCVNLLSPQIDAYLHELSPRAQQKFAQFLALRSHVRDNRVLGLALKREIEQHNRLRDNRNGRSRIDSATLDLIRLLSKWAVDLKCLQTLPTDALVKVDSFYTEEEWSAHYDSDFLDDKTVALYQKRNILNVDPRLNLLIGTVKNEQCAKTMNLVWKYRTDQFNAPRVPKKDAIKIIRNETIVIGERKHNADLLANIYTDETRWKLPRGYFDSIQNLIDDQENNCPVHLYSRAAAASGANSVSHYLITQKATKHRKEASGLYKLDLNDYAWLGPCEDDHLLYLAGAPIRVPNRFTNLDRSFSLKLISIWAHFINNNRLPNLQPSNEVWPTSNRKNPIPRYVEITAAYTRENDVEQKARCEQIWLPLLPLHKH